MARRHAELGTEVDAEAVTDDEGAGFRGDAICVPGPERGPPCQSLPNRWDDEPAGEVGPTCRTADLRRKE